MRGPAALALGLVAVVVAAVWGGGQHRTCPAIGWSNSLTVELGDGWPGAAAVRVECPSWCGLAVEPVDDAPDALTVPLSGSTAILPILMAAPAAVTVTVLGADGAVLTAAALDLEWVRVGGSAECGGPHEATATVLAP